MLSATGAVNCVAIGTLCCALASCASPSSDKPDEPLRSRREFAKAMSELREGMPEAKVLALLGHPDDIWTENDQVTTLALPDTTKEVWRYGTSGHLTTATLGQVYFDRHSRVQFIYGQGSPPPESKFDEHELRRLLDALGQAPAPEGWFFNPRKLIRVVNLLQPLGKERALAAIDEFLRIAPEWHGDGRDGVWLVLRTLFEVPQDPGYLPRMQFGAPSPAEPKDMKLLPRFPLTLEGDIPFLIVESFSFGGAPPQPEKEVEYFRKHGRLRARPLAPSSEPWKELEKMAKSPRWLYNESDGFYTDERGRAMLSAQVLRLMDTVVRVEPNELLVFGNEEGTRRRKEIIRKASNLKIRWNVNAQKYTFRNGTCLPERSLPDSWPIHNRRETEWPPDIDGETYFSAKPRADEPDSPALPNDLSIQIDPIKLP